MSEVPGNNKDQAPTDPTPTDSVQPRLSTSAATTPGAAEAADQATAQKRKPRWWWRWTKRLAIVAVVARLLLWLFLEQLANFGASFAGLSVSWQSASLSLTTLSLHIEDLVVRDAQDSQAPTLLTAEDVVADVSVRQLLDGQLSINDAGLVGARVTVRRDASGQLQLPEAWLQPATPDVPERPDEEAPLSFELPFAIHSARLHDLEVVFIDDTATSASQYAATIDLDVTELGVTDRDGSVTLRVYAPQLCDELSIEAQVQAEAALASCELDAAVRGFRPQRFELPGALSEIFAQAHVVDLQLKGDLNAEVLASAPRRPALGGKLDLGLSLDGVEDSALKIEVGPTEVANPDALDGGIVTPLALSLQIKNLVEDLRIEAGRLTLSDSRATVKANLVATQLTGERLTPLLASAGLSLPPDGINLSASVDADFAAGMSIDLTRLAITSGEADQQTKLERCTVRDLRAIDGSLAIGSVDIVGPDLPIQRTADGSFVLAGLQFSSTTTPRDEDASTTNPPPAPATITLPKIRIGSISWSGAQIAYTDASFEPPAELQLRDLTVQGDAITIGEDAPPGTLNIAFGVPTVADRCAARLTITPGATSLATELQWTSEGATLRGLAPWLRPLGFTPELTSGALAMTATANADFALEGLRADLQVRDLTLVDGDTKWLALASLQGDGIALTDRAVDLGQWTVQDPFVKAHRDAEQTLHAFGLRLGAAGPRDARAPTRAAESGAAATPGSWQHGEISLLGATLAFSDTSQPERLFTIGLDLNVGANDGTETALPITAKLRLDRAVDDCSLDVTIKQRPTQSEITGSLQATGIHGEELTFLLPEGIACTLADGSMRASFQAITNQTEAGALEYSLRDVTLADGEDELAAIDEVVLIAPSTGDGELHIKDAHLIGARTKLAITNDALHVAGLQVASPAPPTKPAATTTTPPSAAQPAPIRLPKLRIDALQLQIGRLEIDDQRSAGGEPLIITAGLKLQEPWRGDPEDDDPLPMRLLVTSDLAPIGANLVAETAITPFDLTPTIDIGFSLTGIDTTQIGRISPTLAKQLRGEAKALAVTASLHAAVNLRRRDASVFDFSRPFGAEADVEDLAIRDQATGESFLSIASIDAVVRSIDATAGNVLVRSLTIDDPVLKVTTDADGTHIAGFLLPNAPPPDPSAPAAALPPTRPADAPREAAGEAAIDRLNLLGLCFDYRDETTDPPTHLSIADTDAEVRQFSTRAFHEPHPMSFSTTVRGGDIELEQRIIASSVIAGILSSGANALVRSGAQHKIEQRPMLDELTASGQLRLYPKAQGQVSLALNELELAAFRGLAKSSGIDLADGLYDMRLQLNLLGYDGLTLQSQNVFTHLMLDEPPNGPIATYLRLPAPLQSILFLLRNSNDQQRIPISLRVPADGISQGTIASLAVESLLKLIADAAAGAGGRILHTGTAGIFGGQSDVPSLTTEITFAAGSPLPEHSPLEQMIAAVRDDPTLSIILSHELGDADIAHARKLANPPARILDATIEQLEARRALLEQRRAPLARELVARYAAGQRQEAARRQAALGQIDDNIGELLAVLGEAHEQKHNSSPRNILRRTREASIELADARLDAVSKQILQAYPELKDGPEWTSRRIERRPGRGLPVADQKGGGRILGVLRRRTAQDLPVKRPIRTRGGISSIRTVGFTAVPPVVDPANRPLNNR